MSRLLGISVLGFRGLRKFSYELPQGQHLLLCGSNGTGKSSLFQALRFGATGGFYPVSSFTGNVNLECYRHKDLGETDVATVTLRFSGKGGEWTLRRSLDARGGVTRELEPASSDPPDGDHQVCFLNRPRFVEMVDAADRTCWERLTPFLGHGELAAFRGGLKALVQQLSKDLDVSALEARKKSLQQEIEAVSAETSSLASELGFSTPTLTDVTAALSNLTELAPLPVNTSGAPDWDALEKAVPGSAVAKEMERRRSQLGQEKRALQGTQVPKPAELEQALDFALNLQKHSQLVHDLVHARLLEAAEPSVADLTEGVCPVCGLQPQDWAAVRTNLAGRISRLAPLKKQLAAAQQALATAQAVTRTILHSLNRLPDEVPKRGARSSLIRSLCAYSDWLDRLVEGLRMTPPRGLDALDRQAVLAARERVREHYRNLLREIDADVKDLEKKATELGGDEALRRFHRLKELHRNLVGLQRRELDLRRLNRRLEETRRITSALSNLNKEVDRAEAALGLQLLKALERNATRIFQAITGSEALKPVLRVTSKAGIRHADIMIEDFHGRGEVRARDYLSEANRNSLGLSLYFAGLLRLNPSLEVLVLDDITHSADNEHRRGLASFLARELSQKMQLVILTHDDTWFDQIGAELPDHETRRERVLSWNIAGIQLKRDNYGTLLQRAEDMIRSQELGGGNILRLALEEFVDEVCEKFHIRVRFCRSEAHLKLDEKTGALLEHLRRIRKEGVGLIDPGARALRGGSLARRIANLASHANRRSRVSQQDLLDALKEVREFMAAFQCKRSNKMGKPCGQLLPGLTRVQGQVPECKRCHKPVMLEREVPC